MQQQFLHAGCCVCPCNHSECNSMFCMQVVVFALGVGSTETDATQLIAAFEAICAACPKGFAQTNHVPSADQDLSQMHKSSSDMDLSSSTSDVNSTDRAGTNDSNSCAGSTDSSSGSSSSSSSSSSSTAFNDVSSSGNIGSSGGSLSGHNCGIVVQSKALHQCMSPRQAFFAGTDR